MLAALLLCLKLTLVLPVHEASLLLMCFAVAAVGATCAPCIRAPAAPPAAVFGGAAPASTASVPLEVVVQTPPDRATACSKTYVTPTRFASMQQHSETPDSPTPLGGPSGAETPATSGEVDASDPETSEFVLLEKATRLSAELPEWLRAADDARRAARAHISEERLQARARRGFSQALFVAHAAQQATRDEERLREASPRTSGWRSNLASPMASPARADRRRAAPGDSGPPSPRYSPHPQCRPPHHRIRTPRRPPASPAVSCTASSSELGAMPPELSQRWGAEQLSRELRAAGFNDPARISTG
jgi:hypothetical protein